MKTAINRGLWVVWVIVCLVTAQLGSHIQAQPHSGAIPTDSIVVLIESQQDVFVGQPLNVPIIVHECPGPLGAMDLTITYDPVAFKLIDVMAMAGIANPALVWDTMSHDSHVDSTGQGPVGILEISGRMRSGEMLETRGETDWPRVVATMQFMVSSNANLECETYLLEFVWDDCDDNTFRLLEQSITVTSRRVIDCYDSTVTTGEEFPNYGGPPTHCVGPETDADHSDKVVFYNGAANIICAGGGFETSPGDLNLNELPYEIADFEVFAEYLLGNEDVLRDRDACAFMSDVNKDGRTWSTEDLASLAAIIIGDYVPYGCDGKPPTRFQSRCFGRIRRHYWLLPEPSPAPRVLADTVTFITDPNAQTIEMIADDTVGVVLLTFDGCVGVEVGVEGIEARHSFDGTNTRVLIMSAWPSDSHGRTLLIGDTTIKIEGTGKLVSASAATFRGCPLAAVVKRK